MSADATSSTLIACWVECVVRVVVVAALTRACFRSHSVRRLFRSLGSPACCVIAVGRSPYGLVGRGTFCHYVFCLAKYHHLSLSKYRMNGDHHKKSEKTASADGGQTSRKTAATKTSIKKHCRQDA